MPDIQRYAAALSQLLNMPGAARAPISIGTALDPTLEQLPFYYPELGVSCRVDNTILAGAETGTVGWVCPSGFFVLAFAVDVSIVLLTAADRAQMRVSLVAKRPGPNSVNSVGVPITATINFGFAHSPVYTNLNAVASFEPHWSESFPTPILFKPGDGVTGIASNLITAVDTTMSVRVLGLAIPT